MSEQPVDPMRHLIIAAHSSLESLKESLAAHPEWIDTPYDWGERGGLETPLGAAAHVGRRDLAEYLLAQGATLTPVAAASLGLTDELGAFIDADSANANAKGAHGISILVHAAIGGSVPALDILQARGNTLADINNALTSAANAGHIDVVRWLLAHGADPSACNFQGKNALELAETAGHGDIAALLKAYF